MDDVCTVPTSWRFSDTTARSSLQQLCNPPNLSFGNCELRIRYFGKKNLLQAGRRHVDVSRGSALIYEIHCL